MNLQRPYPNNWKLKLFLSGALAACVGCQSIGNPALTTRSLSSHLVQDKFMTNDHLQTPDEAPLVSLLESGLLDSSEQSLKLAAPSKPAEPSLPKEDIYQAFRFRAPGTVVAIGDIHGDFNALENALKLAGAIDAKWNWIGGNLVVVQTGDQIDRGDDDRKVLDALAQLTPKAKAAGGQLIVLNGNHEVMNVMAEMQYVTPKAFESFAELDLSPGTKASQTKSSEDLKSNLDRRSPGVEQRFLAFQPKGPYAQLLATRPFFAIVNDTVFVHGAITPRNIRDGLPKMNQELTQWMLGTTPNIPFLAMGSGENPLWNRRYSNGHVSAAECLLLHSVLQSLGVKRMVVGHTVKPKINRACEGQVIRIDVGLSKAYQNSWPDGQNPLALLEIKNDQTQILYNKEINLAETPETHSLTKEEDLPGWTPLTKAVLEGSVDKVRKLIAEDADPNEPNLDGWTPLLLAADKGRLAILKILLDAGANLTSGTPGSGFTPLMLAIINGSPDIARKILSYSNKTELELKDHNLGATALAFAILKKDIPLIELLLFHQAKTSFILKDGKNLSKLIKWAKYPAQSLKQLKLALSNH